MKWPACLLRILAAGEEVDEGPPRFYHIAPITKMCQQSSHRHTGENYLVIALQPPIEMGFPPEGKVVRFVEELTEKKPGKLIAFRCDILHCRSIPDFDRVLRCF
jgi:hypothetical protein